MIKNKKRNMAVREAAERNHLFLWEVADLMGISYSQLMYRMRKEWPEEEQSRVIRLIEEYAKEVN